MDLFDHPNPLAEARAAFYREARTVKGTVCPCCDRYGKIYKRILSAPSVYTLVWAHRRFGQDFFNTEHDLDSLPRPMRGDFHKLKHWGLIVGAEGRREDGNPRNGLWKITEYGVGFIQGRVSIPKYVILYNKKAGGFEGTYEFCSDALLRGGFNYAELMNSAPEATYKNGEER